jgi:hypothetical protein
LSDPESTTKENASRNGMGFILKEHGEKRKLREIRR